MDLYIGKTQGDENQLNVYFDYENIYLKGFTIMQNNIVG